jgi:AcrR family transcriptional regulator
MTTTSRPRRGRRPAGSDTRGAIVRAARTEFAQRGYDATSLREVARQAGVDAALVHHYFDGKAALFGAAMDLPTDPGTRIRALVEQGTDGIGERLVGLFLSVWDPPGTRDPMLALLRSAVSNDEAARLLREFLLDAVARPVALAFGDRDVDLRAGLVVSQLMGLGMLRYVVRVDAIVAAPPEDLVARVGPVLQRYLTLASSPHGN